MEILWALPLASASILSPSQRPRLLIIWEQWYDPFLGPWHLSSSLIDLQFKQIHFAICSNTSGTLDKYVFPFLQIHLAIWTYTFGHLYKYILQFAEIHFELCRLVPAITVRPSPRAKLSPTLDKTSASARTKTKQMREAVQASKDQEK